MSTASRCSDSQTNNNSWYQLVQAAVHEKPSFIMFGTFGVPKAGEKFNSINESKNLNVLCQNKKNKKEISVHQWIKQVSLDELYENKKIPNPSILIIDVDGYESKVISGAKELLKNKNLKKLIIEINYNNRPKILPRVKRFGVKEICRYKHHVNIKHSAYDVFCKR